MSWVRPSWGLRGDSAWCGTCLDWQADTLKFWCFKCKTKHPLSLTTIPPFNLPSAPLPVLLPKLSVENETRHFCSLSNKVYSHSPQHLHIYLTKLIISMYQTLNHLIMFQVFSSGRRETGGGFSRTTSSSLSLLPYFDMADLASSGPYIVSILKTSSLTQRCVNTEMQSLYFCVST